MIIRSRRRCENPGGRYRAKSDDGRVKIRIRILLIAVISTLLAVVCAMVGWAIPTVVFAFLAFGMATAWVAEAHASYVRRGKCPPAWLARLERLRTYLAGD